MPKLGLQDLVRAPTADASDDYTYNTGLFNRVLAAMVDGTRERPEVLAAFVGKFMDEHDDVRNYACRAIAHVADEAAAAQGSKSTKTAKRLAANIYTLLVDLKPANPDHSTPSMFTLDDVSVLGPTHPLRAASTFRKSYSHVRQLRHHFGPIFAHFPALHRPARAACYDLLRAHATRALIGA